MNFVHLIFYYVVEILVRALRELDQQLKHLLNWIEEIDFECSR